LRRVERLTNQARSDRLTVDDNHRAAGLTREDDLGDDGHHGRVNEAGDHRDASRIATAGQSWVRTKLRIVDSYAR